MMTNDTHIDLQSRMQAVLADPGFQSELAQVRSKATLQAIGELRHPRTGLMSQIAFPEIQPLLCTHLRQQPLRIQTMLSRM